jgi:hypothetical protein
VPLTSIEPQAGSAARIAEVRRRIRDRYYDRPEVRRVLSHLILRQIARPSASPTRERPESA